MELILSENHVCISNFYSYILNSLSPQVCPVRLSTISSSIIYMGKLRHAEAPCSRSQLLRGRINFRTQGLWLQIQAPGRSGSLPEME